MSAGKNEKRRGTDRRSEGDRRSGLRERRIKQDSAWLGERDRRKGKTCRRVSEDRRTGEDRRNRGC